MFSSEASDIHSLGWSSSQHGASWDDIELDTDLAYLHTPALEGSSEDVMVFDEEALGAGQQGLGLLNASFVTSALLCLDSSNLSRNHQVTNVENRFIKTMRSPTQEKAIGSPNSAGKKRRSQSTRMERRYILLVV